MVPALIIQLLMAGLPQASLAMPSPLLLLGTLPAAAAVAVRRQSRPGPAAPLGCPRGVAPPRRRPGHGLLPLAGQAASTQGRPRLSREATDPEEARQPLRTR